MKVNSVDNVKFNNIHFERRRNNKDNQKPVHSSNPIKAIPVAVLIAMSPLNAQVIQAQQITNTEQTKSDVFIGNYIYEKSTPNGQTCRIDFFGRAGNQDFNFVKLNFEKNISTYKKNAEGHNIKGTRYSNTIIKPTKLYKYTLTTNYSNGESEVNTRYYVIGPATKYSGVTIDPATNLPINESEKPSIKNITEDRLLITEDFYNDLKELLGDKIKYEDESYTQTRSAKK